MAKDGMREIGPIGDSGRRVMLATVKSPGDLVGSRPLHMCQPHTHLPLCVFVCLYDHAYGNNFTCVNIHCQGICH